MASPSMLTLLTDSLSPSNVIRRSSEQILLNIQRNDPDYYVLGLVRHASTSNDERTVLALLLARQAFALLDNTLDNLKMSQQTIGELKQRMMQCVENINEHTTRAIRRAVVDTTAMLVAKINTITDSNNQQKQKDERKWAELIPKVLNMAQTGRADRKIIALELITAMAEQQNTESIFENMENCVALMNEGLRRPNNQEERMAAFHATVAMIAALQPSERENMQSAIPLLIDTLIAVRVQRDDQAITSAVEVLIDLVQTQPNFLKKQMQAVLSCMLEIVQCQQLDAATRRVALEFLVTLAESRRSMVKKMNEFAKNVIPLATGFVLELDDEQDTNAWIENMEISEQDGDSDANETYNAGLEAVGRLAVALGGKLFLSVAYAITNQWLKEAEWIKRHAAVSVIGVMSEGCAEHVGPQLSELVSVVAPYATHDPHPRVRFAAAHALAHLSDVFAPEFQLQYSTTILPVLIQCTDLSQPAKLIRHAILCLVNFFNGLTDAIENEDYDNNSQPDVLAPFREQLLQRFIQLVSYPSIHVQEASMRGLSALALASKGSFAPYYQALMPGVKNVIQCATSPEQASLRAAAIDAIGYLAEAVGAEQFAVDANFLVEACINMLRSLSSSEAEFTSLHECLARIARILGVKFEPYLPLVLPQLIESAKITNAAALLNANEATEESDGFETINIDLRAMGTKKVSINTTLLSEKTNATNMLYLYATHLRASFFPFVEATASALIPNLSYAYSEKARTAAVAALPALFNSAVQHFDALHQPDQKTYFLQQLWNMALEPLLIALRKEVQLDALIAIIESLNECLQTLSFAPLPQQLQMIDESLKSIIEESVERVKERENIRQEDDLDEGDEEDLVDEQEEEDELLGMFYTLANTLLKITAGTYIDCFHANLSEIYMDMLTSDIESLTTTAMCVLGQMVHDAGATSVTLNYCERLIPVAMQQCISSILSARHAGCFTIGAVASVTQERFKPFIIQALKNLTQVLSAKNARSAQNEPSSDNAISAIGKIARFCHRGFSNGKLDNLASLLPTWLSYLPCRRNGDEEEAQQVHEQLFYFIEHHPIELLGSQQQNLPKLIGVFVQLSAAPELLLPGTRLKIAAFMNRIQQSLSGTQMQALFNGFKQEECSIFERFLKSVVS